MLVTLPIVTERRDQIVDLTDDVRRCVVESRIRSGLCVVACPHTTAGVAVNEGYDPDVARDVLSVLDRLVPWDGGYRHAEGNTAAHVKAVLCGSSQTLLVEAGRLKLGRWQSVWFCEFDGPRRREVHVAIQEAP